MYKKTMQKITTTLTIAFLSVSFLIPKQKVLAEDVTNVRETETERIAETIEGDRKYVSIYNKETLETNTYIYDLEGNQLFQSTLEIRPTPGGEAALVGSVEEYMTDTGITPDVIYTSKIQYGVTYMSVSTMFGVGYINRSITNTYINKDMPNLLSSIAVPKIATDRCIALQDQYMAITNKVKGAETQLKMIVAINTLPLIYDAIKKVMKQNITSFAYLKTLILAATTLPASAVGPLSMLHENKLNLSNIYAELYRYRYVEIIGGTSGGGGGGGGGGVFNE